MWKEEVFFSTKKSFALSPVPRKTAPIALIVLVGQLQQVVGTHKSCIGPSDWHYSWLSWHYNHKKLISSWIPKIYQETCVEREKSHTFSATSPSFFCYTPKGNQPSVHAQWMCTFGMPTHYYTNRLITSPIAFVMTLPLGLQPLGLVITNAMYLMWGALLCLHTLYVMMKPRIKGFSQKGLAMLWMWYTCSTAQQL